MAKQNENVRFQKIFCNFTSDIRRPECNERKYSFQCRSPAQKKKLKVICNAMTFGKKRRRTFSSNEKIKWMQAINSPVSTYSTVKSREFSSLIFQRKLFECNLNQRKVCSIQCSLRKSNTNVATDTKTYDRKRREIS